MTAHHVIIADDHPLFRDALKQTLGSALPGAAITEVGSVEKLLEALSQNANADLVLLDLKMPGEKGAASLSGLTGLMYLRSQHPGHSRGCRLGERQSQHDTPLPQSRRVRFHLEIVARRSDQGRG